MRFEASNINFLFQDIENVDDDELVAGAPQYTDDDVIGTSSETDATASVSFSGGDDVGRQSPRVHGDVTNEPLDRGLESRSPTEGHSDTSSNPDETSNVSDLQSLVTRLTQENEELKRQVVCKICMDPVYTKPLVTIRCLLVLYHTEHIVSK